MDPADALRTIETALRNAIRQVLPSSRWLSGKGAPDAEELRRRQIEEARRRDGVRTSDDLLDYAQTYELIRIVEQNWGEGFKPVFHDMPRTKAYFGVINDVRNAIAHSRALTQFERELLSGIAGHIRNQVAGFRMQADSSIEHYPVIDEVSDSFGSSGSSGSSFRDQTSQLGVPRLNVGDVLDFRGSASAARDKNITWFLGKPKGIAFQGWQVGVGSEVEASYRIDLEDVGELFELWIYILGDSRYHRYGMLGLRVQCDDARTFAYAVNPPRHA